MSMILNNEILYGIFNDEEINQIYSHIQNTDESQTKILSVFGHKAYFSGLPDNITEKILNIAQQACPRKIKLTEVSFARYSSEWGHDVKLFPHYDENFKEPRFTLDIQIKSTVPWAIVVEGEKYILKDNEALIFSGTHQIHWREKIKFSDSDYTDMIFCHFTEDSNSVEMITDEHTIQMDNRKKYWLGIYEQTN